uniref:Glutamate synthase (NADPH/NADH) small chain n=1 Tax=Nannochloropsis gaditana (strain CCMP526) TaxID=1093141 RepID=I2CNZ7_NANGC
MLSASRNHLTRCLRTAVAARQVSVRQFHPSASRLGGSITRHEVWRDDNEQDNLPKVKRRDGSIAAIEKKRGFVDYHRNPDPYRDPLDRVFDWGEIKTDEGHDEVERKVQAARCMDCGTPFCQTHTGCPVNNLIPEWNELVYKGQWREAIDRLHKTNNFPEFTGLVCPAPCEGGCVAGLVDKPVTIKNIEYAIVERAWEEGWIIPRIPQYRSGMSVAVVGSGPSGLAAADCLNQMGHKVTVYEREDRIGGLLMYGIPNMKLDKEKVLRRVDMLREEGIEFVTGTHVGKDLAIEDLRANVDALVLTLGSTVPRDLRVPNREANGIHFAMEFLTKNQKRLMMTREGRLESGWDKSFITAEGKDVIVVGGGDTGTDCIGTSMRHRCKSIVNFELMPRPPNERAPHNPWPQWPKIYGMDYGHAEVQAVFGRDPREYSVMTKEFVKDQQGNVKGLVTVNVEVSAKGITPIPGTEKEWPADLVILAMGFMNPESTIPSGLSLDVDQRHNIRADYGDYRTNVDGVFAAGDCRRGQSLVVWAINEGRGVAESVNKFLIEKSEVTEDEAYIGAM